MNRRTTTDEDEHYVYAIAPVAGRVSPSMALDDAEAEFKPAPERDDDE